VRATAAAERRPPAGGTKHILATAKGGGFLVAGTLFEYATRFMIGILLARGLGAHGYGLYVLSISVATLFAGISMLGTDDAMVRYVAILTSRDDREGVAGTLQVGLATATIGGTLMGIALFVFAEPVAVGLFDSPELESALKLMALVVPFLALSNELLGIARGFKRMDYAAYSQNGVQSVVRLVLIALLFFAGSLSIYPAVIAFGLSDVAASLALVLLLNRRFPLRETMRRGIRRDVRSIFSFALPLWISGLLRQFRNSIQNLLVGSLGTIAGVGVLSIANRVNDVAAMGPKSIYIASRPLMAQLHDRGERDELRDLYATTTRWTLALNIPLFLVMTLYPTSLLLVFGEQFASGATALALVACAQMISAATGTCQGVLDMTGHTRLKLANTIAWTVLLIGGGAYAIPRWGVVGAAASALVAIGTVNIAAVIEVYVLEHVHPYDRTFVKPVVAGVLAGIGGLVLRAVAPPVGIVPGLVQGTLVSLVFIGLVLAMGLEPEDRLIVERLWARVRRLLGRDRVTVDTGGAA
jgi:O-antigen/teichoic acid export membrane protein